jgi:hypothetical protein
MAVLYPRKPKQTTASITDDHATTLRHDSSTTYHHASSRDEHRRTTSIFQHDQPVISFCAGGVMDITPP